MTNNQKDTIVFLMNVTIGAMTFVVTYRLIAGPNSLNLLKLKAAKGVENFCQGQAEGWAHLADASKRGYDKLRTVSV